MSTSNTRLMSSPGVLSRRELLSYAWLAALAAVAGAGVCAGLRFARPRPRPNELGGVVSMGSAAELPPPGSPPVNQPEGRFWLVATDAGVLAIHKACTHLDCLCDWDEQNREFVCPCHGSRFAEDGTYLEGPAARSLDRFVVQVVAPSGEIIAETDPVRGSALLLADKATAGLTTNDADTAEVKEEETATEDPGHIVLVDTGRKVLGTASDER